MAVPALEDAFPARGFHGQAAGCARGRSGLPLLCHGRAVHSCRGLPRDPAAEQGEDPFPRAGRTAFHRPVVHAARSLPRRRRMPGPQPSQGNPHVRGVRGPPGSGLHLVRVGTDGAVPADLQGVRHRLRHRGQEGVSPAGAAQRVSMGSPRRHEPPGNPARRVRSSEFLLQRVPACCARGGLSRRRIHL